ncbi:GTP-binding protein REM 1 [Sipha flava]|uniref:GTP-binding protein REM 1 n=1 Tax=Sipha flava TaxID=143950 RepID=A0A8B8F1Z3_9HEMI|nr:GTP-binding protein REM 1 [Sipha flava]XP_025404794.1 GTP-binding protein REM 1 [Sipha flava]XP_025404795.1 GTP-binding protein REM 1 [Sipha flava]
MATDDNGLLLEAMYNKGRSASICAFGFPPGSTEHLVGGTTTATASTPPPHRHVSGGAAAVAAAEDNKRRRPAVRSQSARTSGGRSIRKKTLVAAAIGAQHEYLSDSKTSVRSGYSDPRLNDLLAHDGTAFKRKPSSRKVNSNHRKSGAFLDVPPGDNKKLVEPEDPENSYRLRSFSFTSKGIVNRGDSFRKRRSRSNSLAQEDDTKECTPPINNNQQQQSQQNDCDDITSYTVSLMGSRGVGKTTLISQFMTSEYINTYERQRDNYESSMQSVCIMLNGEESELKFVNEREVLIKEDRPPKPADAFLVIFSVVDKNSFEIAETILKNLREHEMMRSRPAILVGNKVDMARSREVSAQEGRYLACTCRAKYIEVSVGINHNVDELLVGILTQIRLKRANNDEGHDHWYKNRNFIKASLKARQMITWVFGKEDTKMKNCENLHIL